MNIPPNAIGSAILSFEGDDAGPLGHSHLWFCQCNDQSIPRHACARPSEPASTGLGVERLARAIRNTNPGGKCANSVVGHNAVCGHPTFQTDIGHVAFVVAEYARLSESVPTVPQDDPE